jgi:hypothetical protein
MQRAIRTVGTAPGTILAVNDGYAAVRVGDRIDLMSFRGDKPHVCCRIVEDIKGHDDYTATLLQGRDQLTTVDIRHAHRPHRGLDYVGLQRASALLTELPYRSGSATIEVDGTSERGFVHVLLPGDVGCDLLAVGTRCIRLVTTGVPIPSNAYHVDLRVTDLKIMVAYSTQDRIEQEHLLYASKFRARSRQADWKTERLLPHIVRKRSIYTVTDGRETIASEAVKHYWMTRRYRAFGDRLAWIGSDSSRYRIYISPDRKGRDAQILPHTFDEVGELLDRGDHLVAWGSVGNELLKVTLTP